MKLEDAIPVTNMDGGVGRNGLSHKHIILEKIINTTNMLEEDVVINISDDLHRSLC